jgi:hypothetical protein
VTWKQVQELPIPESVIKRIKEITAKEKQENIYFFTNRNATPIEDGDDVDGGVAAGVDD